MVAPPCYIEGMKDHRRPKPTTPEQEGIELHPEAWERFERTFDRLLSHLRLIERQNQLPGIGRIGNGAIPPSISRTARALRFRVADEFFGK